MLHGGVDSACWDEITKGLVPAPVIFCNIERIAQCTFSPAELSKSLELYLSKLFSMGFEVRDRLKLLGTLHPKLEL